MRRSLSYFLFLLWFSYLIVSSILLFMQGFLLTRSPLPNISKCMTDEDISCLFEDHIRCSKNQKPSMNSNDHKVATNLCLKPKTRVIWIIVDALRYDFLSFDEKNNNPLSYQNKIPVIHDLLSRSPNSTRLYKFIADPPTVTIPRLKALTTGSLPTFIDASSNFASSEIHEDNIIDQLVKNKYDVVFMGDDTWNGLYPNRFTRHYSYQSFAIWDLDTVDTYAKKQLFLELNNTDWNLLIGYFLGVDHCGHAYGPSHPKMARKLTEINAVIEDVVKQMDENMMLFVIGDHGMTATGSHGGDSFDEVSAGLFVYSKRELLNIAPISESIKQIDLVPTLSTILGIPIPFQNLGVIILNCLPIQDYNFEQHFKTTLYTLWSNVEQIVQYIQEYSKIDQVIEQKQLNALVGKYSVLKEKLSSVTNREIFSHFHKDTQTLLNNLHEMCAEVWAQYEPFSMVTGLFYLCSSISFMFIIVVVDGKLPHISLISFLIHTFFAAAIAVHCYFLNFSDSLMANIFFATGLVSQPMLVIHILQNWRNIEPNFSVKNLKYTLSQMTYCIVLIFNLSSLFSNSYIIEESFVLRFLLITVILVIAVPKISPNNTSVDLDKESSTFKLSTLKPMFLSMIMAVLIRISVYFSRCRQEQQWCFDSVQEYVALVKSEVSKFQWLLTVVILSLYVLLIRNWFGNCDKLNAKDSFVKIFKYFPIAIVVCVSLYWAMKNGNINKTETFTPELANIVGWVAYCMISLGILSYIIEPLRGYVKTMEIYPKKEQNIMRKLFQFIWPSMEDEYQNVFVGCGLATAYSSVFFMLGLYLTLLFAFLLGNRTAPAVMVMFFTNFFVLLVTSVIRIKNATTLEQLFHVPNVLIFIWIILAQYFFYGTGHQPSFPNIAWEAAFVGREGKSKDTIIPATLVLLNTFCSHIFMGIMLPLFIIMPFSLMVMIPSIIDKKPEMRRASVRGEIVLSDQDSRVMITSIFTLASKYIIGHGIRVFTIMLAATVHCRHPMAWGIFVPKLIFESIGMIMTLTSVLIGCLILVRINNQVRKFVIRFFSMETIFQY